MNDIKLGDSQPVTEELKPLKIGGESTALEVSKEDVRVNNLYVNGTTTGVSASDSTKLPLAGGTMTGDITTDSDIISTNLIINDSGDISLDADGGEIRFKDGDTEFARFSTALSKSALILFESAGSSDNDYFGVSVGASASTIIATTDGDGTGGDLTVDIDGDIILDSHTGVFIAKKAGTEFSVANSAYAGMILGYTRIANDATGSTDNIINMTSTMTVLQTNQGTDVSVAFVAPPSGNVEIQFSCVLYTSTTTVGFALSDNASFNEINETHTYDQGSYKMDETDLNTIIISWAVTGLTAGTSYTYFIAGDELSGSTSSIYHGRFRSTGKHYPPIIVKAIALPATIVTGE